MSTITEELAADLGVQKIDAPAEVSRETPPVAPVEPARDEHGRFAAKAVDPATPQPVETPAAPAAPVAAPEAKTTVDGIPLSVALEWKADLKEAKRRLAELEQGQQQQIQVPSPLEDPDGYAAYQQELVNRAQTSARFDTSELIARSAHGDDLVQKAMDWGMERAGASPAFAAEYLKQRHPIDWAVKQFEQENWLKEVGSDKAARDAWALKRAAELAANPATPSPQPAVNGSAAQPQPQAVQQPTPQRSLAAAPTAGSHIESVPLGLEAATMAVFPR